MEFITNPFMPLIIAGAGFLIGYAIYKAVHRKKKPSIFDDFKDAKPINTELSDEEIAARIKARIAGDMSSQFNNAGKETISKLAEDANLSITK